MPILKLCNVPGCKDWAVQGSAKCERHFVERKPFEKATRSNTSFYNTTEWKELRKEVIKEEGCCAFCGGTDNLTVDHIMPPRGNSFLFFDRRNLQVLCVECHRIKTAKEIGERNNARKN